MVVFAFADLRSRRCANGRIDFAIRRIAVWVRVAQWRFLRFGFGLTHPVTLHVGSCIDLDATLHVACCIDLDATMLQCSDLDATVHGASLPAVLLVTAVLVLRIPARRAPAVMHRAAARCTGAPPAHTSALRAILHVCFERSHACLLARALAPSHRRGAAGGGGVVLHGIALSTAIRAWAAHGRRQAAQCSAIHDSCAVPRGSVSAGDLPRGRRYPPGALGDATSAYGQGPRGQAACTCGTPEACTGGGSPALHTCSRQARTVSFL
jgi:hypothetical protein